MTYHIPAIAWLATISDAYGIRCANSYIIAYRNRAADAALLAFLYLLPDIWVGL